ncbi:MAG: ATP-binding protein [Xanthobacteraceae bacterium]
MPVIDEDLEMLLSSGEADRTERKRNSADPDRIREAVCAFANDLPDHREPGVVFVGIEDNGSCSNLAIDDELLLGLGQIRDDGAITPFPMMEVRRATVNSCAIAVIIVHPSENPPVRFRGRAWIRVGPRRAIASPEEERRLIEKRRWGNLPFDAQPVSGATLDDLDLNRFKLEYVPSLVSVDTVAQNQRTTQQQLRALRLIGRDEVPTTTAILMLGKSPQDWFPGAILSWRRIAGINLTDETLDERTLTGTIPDQLRRIDEFMDTAIAESVAMASGTHIRATDYPLAALQQLVRNAVMHRTYDGANAPVRVTWYSDRIEILSPGGPFGAITPETFGQPGFTDYRNPTIAEALKGYGFVERFGQGLEIVRRALAANGNLPAEFQFEPPNAPTWVHAIVRKRT